MKPSVLVSACLLGTPCRYDGKSKPQPAIRALADCFTLISVCPEQLGGLPTPRIPAERSGNRVITRDGRDVSEEYCRGAKATLAIARENHCCCAILKERSPSCGCGEIYDGSFAKRLIKGDGVTAELLKKHGIVVFGETHPGLQSAIAEIAKVT